MISVELDVCTNTGYKKICSARAGLFFCAKCGKLRIKTRTFCDSFGIQCPKPLISDWCETS